MLHKKSRHVIVSCHYTKLPTNIVAHTHGSGKVVFSCNSVNLIKIDLRNRLLIPMFKGLAPLASSWPHLRCDVGLEEREYK